MGTIDGNKLRTAFPSIWRKITSLRLIKKLVIHYLPHTEQNLVHSGCDSGHTASRSPLAQLQIDTHLCESDRRSPKPMGSKKSSNKSSITISTCVWSNIPPTSASSNSTIRSLFPRVHGSHQAYHGNHYSRWEQNGLTYLSTHMAPMQRSSSRP